MFNGVMFTRKFKKTNNSNLYSCDAILFCENIIRKFENLDHVKV